MLFYKRIAKNINDLNKTDKKIIQFITDCFDQYDNIKISDISKPLYISPNAVVRLAQKLEYSEFSEMKYEINRHLEEREDLNIKTSKSFLDIHSHIYKGVQTTLDLNSNIKLNEAVERIVGSKKIVFFSLGITQNYSQSFMQQLQVFEKICILSTDRDNALTLAKNIDSNFLAFFISMSGDTDALVQSASYLKHNKVPIIALTGLNQNSLQEFADISLYAQTNITYVDNTDISSRIYLDIVLETIIQKIINNYQKET